MYDPNRVTIHRLRTSSIEGLSIGCIFEFTGKPEMTLILKSSIQRFAFDRFWELTIFYCTADNVSDPMEISLQKLFSLPLNQLLEQNMTTLDSITNLKIICDRMIIYYSFLCSRLMLSIL